MDKTVDFNIYEEHLESLVSGENKLAEKFCVKGKETVLNDEPSISKPVVGFHRQQVTQLNRIETQ